MKPLELIEHETGVPVAADTPLESLGLDSLEFLDLVNSIECYYSIKLPSNGVAILDTVGDLVNLIGAERDS